MEKEDSSKKSLATGPFAVNLGSAINAFSASPSARQLVAAGRELLKVVSADAFDEIFNLRVGKVNLNYSSNDVKWNPFEQHKHWIASAATNGAVVLWNLDSKGKKLGTLIFGSYSYNHTWHHYLYEIF
jgi:WD repeat-containing protein 24